MVNDSHVSNYRMKMRESNVPRSKLESISYKRPSLLERLELKEFGRREDNITSNVLSTEKDSLLAEDSELVQKRVGIILCMSTSTRLKQTQLASPCFFTHTVPVRSDIPVSEFPDYVIDMTAENQHDTSKLAIEYQVGSIHKGCMHL